MIAERTPERNPAMQAAMDAGYARAIKRQQRRMSRYRGISFGSIAYIFLALSGWCATTLLAAAGCFTLVFSMAGNGSLSGFFEQVQLLSSHYLSATPGSRSSFDNKLLIASFSTLLLTGFFRRGNFIAIFKEGSGDGQHSST